MKTRRIALIITTVILFILAMLVGVLFRPKNGLPQVNTEAMRKEMKNGFTRTGGFNYSLNKGNSNYSFFDVNLRIDYLKNNYYSFLASNWRQGEEDDNDLVDKGFVHLRFVYMFEPWFGLEQFNQIEYNKFIELEDRKLTGGGTRVRLFNKDWMNVYAGIGFMYEHESYVNNIESTKRLVRSTNYLTGKIKINDRVDFSVISYYQYDMNSFSDYRILCDGGFKIKLSEWLKMSTTVNYRYDSDPVVYVVYYDLSMMNGLIITF